MPSKDYTFGPFGDPRSNFDAGEHFELSKAIHAEAALIAQAARRGAPLDGASVYVTTFPCPVCAKSIAAAGITKVYYTKGYSLFDAEDVLGAAHIEIIQVIL
jgi:dCMP deaminase